MRPRLDRRNRVALPAATPSGSSHISCRTASVTGSESTVDTTRHRYRGRVSQYARADRGSLIAMAGRDVHLRIDQRNPHPLDRAVEDLAGAVRRQWLHEAETRSLLGAGAVRTRWTSAGARTLGDAWREVPSKQLLVVGDPAQGKTSGVLLLTLELLAQRSESDPVPVLLPISSWNPAEHLHAWAARRLADDYPALTDRRIYSPDAPLRLVLDRRVVLVLDGLDELPSGLRRSAVEALNYAAAGDYPLIVTCRRADFEQIRSERLPLLPRAMVVAALPIAATTAIGSLASLQDDRWNVVLRHLQAYPQGRLATVLSSPLMLQLVRTVYSDPRHHPGELCALADHATQEQIESHLLDLFLPAAYRSRPRPPDPVRAIRPEPAYDLAKVSRWLTFLARLNTPDLAWWNLKFAVSRDTVGLLGGLLTFVVATTSYVSTAFLTVPDPEPAAIYASALIIALVSGIAATLLLASSAGRPLPPSKLALPKAKTAPLRWAGAVSRLVVGIGIFTLLMGGLSLLAITYPLMLLAVFVFTPAVRTSLGRHVRWFNDFTHAPLGGWDASSPRITLRRSRNAALVVFLAFVLCYSAILSRK